MSPNTTRTGSGKANPKYKRKYTRFDPDPLTYALIDLDGKKDKKKFNPEHVGMIVQEAHGGCGLVVSSKLNLKERSICYLKLGNLPVLKAEVRWVAALDKDVSRAGFQYLE